MSSATNASRRVRSTRTMMVAMPSTSARSSCRSTVIGSSGTWDDRAAARARELTRSALHVRLVTHMTSDKRQVRAVNPDPDVRTAPPARAAAHRRADG
jgi:hypothetical protein